MIMKLQRERNLVKTAHYGHRVQGLGYQPGALCQPSRSSFDRRSRTNHHKSWGESILGISGGLLRDNSHALSDKKNPAAKPKLGGTNEDNSVSWCLRRSCLT